MELWGKKITIHLILILRSVYFLFESLKKTIYFCHKRKTENKVKRFGWDSGVVWCIVDVSKSATTTSQQ